MTPEELEVQAGIDVDEYFVESIVDHEERGRNVKNRTFWVRWADKDSWLNWNAVKDLATLDTYSQDYPELKLGWRKCKKRYEMVDIRERESIFQVLEDFRYTLRKLGFCH